MKDIATIFIEKITFGNSIVQASQIGVIFSEEGQIKCLHYFIENSAKKSMNATPLKTALLDIYAIIDGKKLILFNVDDVDYKFLKQSYKKLHLDFNNEILDVAKKAKEIGIKKINLKNLCHLTKVSSNNSKKIPSSLFKARQLYLVANAFFKLNG
ncbi:MAG: ribonuclease H-like domain-containing protein [Mycoplasmoidaceae bacterium]